MRWLQLILITVKQKKFDFLPLTKIKGIIKSFISDSCYWKGGYDGPENWASGYDFLSNKIEWDKNSEKIGIHIADAPGHGNFFYWNKFLQNRSTESSRNSKTKITTTLSN